MKMNRKIAFTVLGLIAIASVVMGAAARNELYFIQTGDVTIDSTTSSNWQQIDSVVVVFDSASSAIISVSGVAVMDRWDILYIGFGNDSANRVDAATAATTGQTNSNLDSFYIHQSERDYYPTGVHKARTPFVFTFIADYAALTDTFYVNAAVVGTHSRYKVELEDVFFKVELVKKK